ncbi:hypothetical protein [Pedobacter sp.]|uniref:hypothetical protein n=1 Tax=Pedobacter sp. TaxID=1411316 RepID=UPI003C63A7D9
MNGSNNPIVGYNISMAADELYSVAILGLEELNTLTNAAIGAKDTAIIAKTEAILAKDGAEDAFAATNNLFNSLPTI